MATLLEKLDQPIDWHDSTLWPMLGDLQGNILKGHGRDHSENVFLRFDPARLPGVRAALRGIAAHLTSALTQLRETQAYKQQGRPGGTAVFFALSAEGYRVLGLTPPGDPVFGDGMAARSSDLADPSADSWEEHLRGVHALLIIADETTTQVANASARLTAGFAAAGITILGRDAGHALRRPMPTGKGPGLEHFGYIDGRSQPLLLADEVAAEPATAWNPAFSPLRSALVRDPHGGFEESFGSYLVYRKLEQNVAGFKAHEDALADALGLVGKDRERAGAMVVGRFEDGTPLVLHPTDGAGAINDFNYDADRPGLRCPFQAHIRKTNPRGDTVHEFGADEQEERDHLMPRRGITYGERADLPDLEGPFPSIGVGLLFMAYNADISRQFEFTQIVWANNPSFLRPGTGLDPIIGQVRPGDANPPQQWREHYGAPASPPISFAFDGFVTFKGGEYLFAPALSMLASL